MAPSAIVWRASNRSSCSEGQAAEAYLDGTIEKHTYQEHARKIDTDLTEARVSLTEATGGEIDIEAVLTFAEQVLGDPGALWRSLPVAKKIRLQSAIFPKGLAFDGQSYRTAVTGAAFAACAELAAENGGWRPREDSNL